MANRDDELRKKTFKEEDMEVDRRVFYTLQQDKALQEHRNSKAIALLINLLHKNGTISGDELDELLSQTIR
jgi:hypothetical protein